MSYEIFIKTVCKYRDQYNSVHVIIGEQINSVVLELVLNSQCMEKMYLLWVCKERKHEIVSVLSVHVYSSMYIISTCILHCADKMSSRSNLLLLTCDGIILYADVCTLAIAVKMCESCDLHYCVMWIYLESFDHVTFICFTQNTLAY